MMVPSIRLMAMRTVPTKMPMSFIGILPTIIMQRMVTQSNMAVDKFSNPIRKTNGATATKINLKALLLAPFSVCMALRICATASITAPLASSDGWKLNPTRLIHLDAPFAD